MLIFLFNPRQSPLLLPLLDFRCKRIVATTNTVLNKLLEEKKYYECDSVNMPLSKPFPAYSCLQYVGSIKAEFDEHNSYDLSTIVLTSTNLRSLKIFQKEKLVEGTPIFLFLEKCCMFQHSPCSLTSLSLMCYEQEDSQELAFDNLQYLRNLTSLSLVLPYSTTLLFKIPTMSLCPLIVNLDLIGPENYYKCNESEDEVERREIPQTLIEILMTVTERIIEEPDFLPYLKYLPLLPKTYYTIGVLNYRCRDVEVWMARPLMLPYITQFICNEDIHQPLISVLSGLTILTLSISVDNDIWQILEGLKLQKLTLSCDFKDDIVIVHGLSATQYNIIRQDDMEIDNYRWNIIEHSFPCELSLNKVTFVEDLLINKGLPRLQLLSLRRVQLYTFLQPLLKTITSLEILNIQMRVSYDDNSVTDFLHIPQLLSLCPSLKKLYMHPLEISERCMNEEEWQKQLLTYGLNYCKKLDRLYLGYCNGTLSSFVTHIFDYFSLYGVNTVQINFHTSKKTLQEWVYYAIHTIKPSTITTLGSRLDTMNKTWKFSDDTSRENYLREHNII